MGRKPPDALFGKALTASSKSFEKLYPGLAGPTMILNLPFILQAFVGLFKPLFPKSVQAPHATAINEFVSPKNILTLSTAKGDLVYVIRASGVDDKTMMSKVSVDQVVDFFLYAKEVHSLVANARSKQSGRLCNVIFANDITGTRKPPDALFGKALTASSKSFEKLYPGLAGPTMILNLPFILQAFVGLFKPLFP